MRIVTSAVFALLGIPLALSGHVAGVAVPSPSGTAAAPIPPAPDAAPAPAASSSANAGCPAPADGSVVAVPGHPFGLVTTVDGCWMFVSLWTSQDAGALAVLRARGGAFVVARTLPLPGGGSGETLTRDGKLLLVTAWNGGVAAFDVATLEQPTGDARTGTLRDDSRAGAIYAITSLDDRLLFVSEENRQRLAVYDLAKWRANGFRHEPLIGYVPTGIAPVGLALSPDGRWLYSTSEEVPPRLERNRDCAPENAHQQPHAQGLLLRIDVGRAAQRPAASVERVIAGGCNPVRVAVSPDGAYLWVSARDGHAVERIATEALASPGGAVNLSRFDVGGGPVGIAVRPDGKQVWVALANRYGNTKYNPQGREVVGLLGVDAAEATSVSAVSEPASAFPREIAFLSSGRDFAVGLFTANRIEFFTTPP